MTTSALLCLNYDCSDEQHVCSQAQALSGTILVARPLMFWLLTLDLPSEVQTWHSWSRRHTGTTASPPTSQRDQNRQGYKIRHHTRLPPNTPSIQEYTYMQMPQSPCTHTHTHTRQSLDYCKGINPLNLICSKHSLPFSFLPYLS